MATPAYEAARRMIASLTREEQLRLLGEIATQQSADASNPASVMELCGLGREIWQGMDAQQYVSRERASWNG